MTDYQYLKKNNLYEAHKKFVRALGEGYGYAPIEEDDDDMMGQDKPKGGPDDDGFGGMNGSDAPQGGGMSGMGEGPQQDDNGMGGRPQDGGIQGMGGNGPQGGLGGDPMQQGGAPQGGEEPTAMDGSADSDDGFPPSGDDDMGDDEHDAEEEDDVIDVDDITNAQEKMNDKVNTVGQDLGKVDTRIEKLLGAIDKLKDMFDRNNDEIADLKREFEKRNPTQTEKLNLRSLDSYPFNVKPTDYWADKATNGNYEVYSDNSEPTEITNTDVDDYNDREIADSFSIDDDLNQDIRKIFGI